MVNFLNEWAFKCFLPQAISFCLSSPSPSSWHIPFYFNHAVNSDRQIDNLSILLWLSLLFDDYYNFPITFSCFSALGPYLTYSLGLLNVLFIVFFSFFKILREKDILQVFTTMKHTKCGQMYEPKENGSALGKAKWGQPWTYSWRTC